MGGTENRRCSRGLQNHCVLSSEKLLDADEILIRWTERKEGGLVRTTAVHELACQSVEIQVLRVTDIE
jgi:hypothetical protein